MLRPLTRLLVLLSAAVLLAGCATKPRQLMPTPALYQQPGGEALFEQTREAPGSTDVDLLFITDRGAETDPESALPYGQDRAKRIAFGSARVLHSGTGRDAWDAGNGHGAAKPSPSSAFSVAGEQDL